MAHVVVIGGGIGGTAAAARLAKLRHAVTLVERLDRLGGAVGFLEQDGYRWDTGPTSTALPAAVRDLFGTAAGETRAGLAAPITPRAQRLVSFSPPRDR